MSARNRTDAELALAEKARRVLPAGTFGNVPFDTVIKSGKGGRVWDESGNEYVDYLLGSGPMLVGHCHPEVVKAVEEQIERGSTFFANNKEGIELAAEIVEAVPCAEKVRFLSSGSEATFYAMRIARAHRKRDKILKFEGGFHGMSDYALMSMAPKRPGNFPQAIPDSAGIPAKVRDEMLIAPYNDAATAVSMIEEHKDELGGVIVEPLQRLIPPKPGFLQALRDVTRKHGIPLIFDEVVTGFRFAYGGGQAYYGVTPDICAIGKVVGGGFPLSVVTGSEELMEHFDRSAVPEDEVVAQIGTLSGNPVAAAAGLATLAILKRPGAYERIFSTGRELMSGLESALRSAGFKVRVLGEAPMFDVYFLEGDASDYRGTLKANADFGKRFNQLLRERGIFKSDGKTYVSLAHTDEDVRFTIDAYKSAAKELAKKA